MLGFSAERPLELAGELLPRLLGAAADGGADAARSTQETSSQGGITGSVVRLVRALGLRGSSRSQIWRLGGETDAKSLGFLDRPLEGT